MTNAPVPDDPDNIPEPPNLRFLRLLVTVLTATMIIGLVAVISLLVIRLPDPAPTLPEKLVLPDGVQPEAVTFGQTWIAVVAGDEILIYDRSGTALRQRIPLISE